MTAIATIRERTNTSSSVSASNSNKKPKISDFHSDNRTLTSILKNNEDVGVNILSFLEAKVCAGLHEVSSEWHHFLIEIEENLFASHLVNDFAEGQVLQYVANQRNLSFKKLYMAFLKRWCLHKQDKGAISVSYRGSCGRLFPNTEFPENINVATSQFVFIARHGSYGKDPTACALLEWDPEVELTKGRLRIDEKWTNETGGMVEREVMAIQSAKLTLHVLDLKFYSVATLMNEASPECFPNNTMQRPLEIKISSTKFDWDSDEYTTAWLCEELPRNSPYYGSDYEDYTYSPYEITGTVVLQERDEKGPVPWMDDYYSDSNSESDSDSESEKRYDYLKYKLANLSLQFDHSHPVDLCRFMSALMRDKCSNEVDYQYSAQEQPTWMCSDNIVNNIISYASFEDQAGSLSLVCHKLRSSALGQLSKKLERRGVLAYGGSECGGWHKVEVQRGWSDTFLTDRESTVDGALWLVQCCCKGKGMACKNKESCQCGQPRVYTVGGEEMELDLNSIKESLIASGTANLTSEKREYVNRYGCKKEEYLYTAQANFTTSKREIWSLFDEIRRSVDNHYLWFDMKNFQKDFGVKRIQNGWSDDVIRPKQFVRTCLYALARQSIGDCVDAIVHTGKIKMYSPISDDKSIERWITIH